MLQVGRYGYGLSLHHGDSGPRLQCCQPSTASPQNATAAAHLLRDAVVDAVAASRRLRGLYSVQLVAVVLVAVEVLEPVGAPAIVDRTRQLHMLMNLRRQTQERKN